MVPFSLPLVPDCTVYIVVRAIFISVNSPFGIIFNFIVQKRNCGNIMSRIDQLFITNKYEKSKIIQFKLLKETGSS